VGRRKYHGVLKAVLCCTLVHGAYNFTVSTHEFANTSLIESAARKAMMQASMRASRRRRGMHRHPPETPG